jgi:hypothetical protein
VNELFRMNEHGDVWQEPTLFDQGEPLPEVLTCHLPKWVNPRTGKCENPEHDGPWPEQGELI